MTDNCATCRFWKSDDGKTGLCVRYPPTPIMIGLQHPAIVADPNRSPNATPAIMSYFPSMLDFGWCGEHMARLAS